MEALTALKAFSAEKATRSSNEVRMGPPDVSASSASLTRSEPNFPRIRRSECFAGRAMGDAPGQRKSRLRNGSGRAYTGRSRRCRGADGEYPHMPRTVEASGREPHCTDAPTIHTRRGKIREWVTVGEHHRCIITADRRVVK